MFEEPRKPSGLIDIRKIIRDAAIDTLNAYASRKSIHVLSLKLALQKLDEHFEVQRASALRDRILTEPVLNIGVEDFQFYYQERTVVPVMRSVNLTSYLNQQEIRTMGISTNIPDSFKSHDNNIIFSIAQRLPFLNESFKSIISVGLFATDYFQLSGIRASERPESYEEFCLSSAKEMARVLKPGGIVLIMGYEADSGKILSSTLAEEGLKQLMLLEENGYHTLFYEKPDI